MVGITMLGWVLECYQLCNPTAELRRTWETKEACRMAVIHNLNSRPEHERFSWSCSRKIELTPVFPSRRAEDLEVKP